MSNPKKKEHVSLISTCLDLVGGTRRSIFGSQENIVQRFKSARQERRGSKNTQVQENPVFKEPNEVSSSPLRDAIAQRISGSKRPIAKALAEKIQPVSQEELGKDRVEETPKAPKDETERYNHTKGQQTDETGRKITWHRGQAAGSSKRCM